MPVWTVSQKFSYLQWRRLFQELWSRPTNDCRFRTFTLTNSLHQRHLLAGRKGSRPRYVLVRNFLRKPCNGSKKWSWLIQWSELRSSSSTRGISMPNFEVLDARIASALNKIIHNSQNNRPRKRTVSFAADRLPT